MAKTVDDAGEKGVEYSDLMLAVPEWDVEETTDGAVLNAYAKAGEKYVRANIPFHYTVRRNEKEGIKQYVVRKDGYKPKKIK